MFDLLGGVPKWLERLLELIDNILKLLLGLFSRRAATDAQINEERVLTIRNLTQQLEQTAST